MPICVTPCDFIQLPVAKKPPMLSEVITHIAHIMEGCTAGQAWEVVEGKRGTKWQPQSKLGKLSGYQQYFTVLIMLALDGL